MTWLRKNVRPEQVRELSLLLLIVVAVLVFGSMIPGYYTSRTFNRIGSSVAIITVVAVGQTLVVLTRNIDLSVGSIVGFTAYFAGTEVAARHGLSATLLVLMSIMIGAGMGAINGVLVAWGRVPSIIVTLGTLAIYRGILIDYSGAKTVTTDSLPAWLVDLPQRTLFTLFGLDIRVMVALAVAVVAVWQFATMYLNFCRRFYAIGSNPDAAQLMGLPTRRIVFTVMTLSGALSGLAGFMTLARFGNITVEAGRGLELQVVAAVVVGGVNIFGGSGTVVGAMLGAVMIGTLEQSLLRLQISEFWLDAILGLLILLAVASDAVILNRLRALWGRAEMKYLASPPEAAVRDWPMTLLGRLQRWEVLLLALLVAVAVDNAMRSPYFLTVGNVVNLFQLSIEKIMVALSMTLIIVNGEIDLSVASIMGLSACVMAWLFQHGVPLPLAMLASLACGALAGLNNGFWVAYVGLPSLAVTLAGLIGYRGVARILIEDRAIGGFPAWFGVIGQQEVVGPLTVSLIVFVLLFLAVGVVLHFSALGRLVYVIGNNVQAARYSGVRVRRVKMSLFVTSGVVAALAGLLYAARLGSVRGDTAEGFELDIITIVLLGGVSIFGGSGNLVGVGLSILLILCLRNGMGLADITGNTQTSVIGALLILSVLAPNLTQEIHNRWKGRAT